MQMNKRGKIVFGCCTLVFLVLVGGVVLLLIIDRIVFRHVLHIENRSSQKFYKVEVLWPNGYFDTIWQFKVGDKKTLIYHPHTDGEARLLFYIPDKEKLRVRYAEPGMYTTSCFGNEEEWIIKDDGVEATSILSGERSKPKLCPILIEEPITQDDSVD